MPHTTATKPLLILDLNGVLVLSQHRRAPNNAPVDYRANRKYVYRRPGVADFLDFVFAHFDVAIWTSNQRHNAEATVDGLLDREQREQLKFLWAREQCTPLPNWRSRKSIHKVREHPSYRHYRRIFVLDDSPEKIEGATACINDDPITFRRSIHAGGSGEASVIYVPVRSFVDPLEEGTGELRRLQSLLWYHRVHD